MCQIEQKVRDLVHDASTLTLAETVSAQAAQIPEQAAILAPHRRWLTYKQLHMQIQSVVRQLNSTGIGRNDRVAIVLPNGPELAVTVLAVSAAATSAPLNPSYRAAEFDFFLSDMGAKALIVLEGMDSPARTIAQVHNIPVVELSPDLRREAGLFTLRGCEKIEKTSACGNFASTKSNSCGRSFLRNPINSQTLSSASTLTAERTELARPDDVALVLHTSGTTSRAKLVNLTHANLWNSARNIRMTLALGRQDRCLNVMPLFHVHGLVGALFSSIGAGASVVCTPGFDAAQFFDCLEVFHPTWYTAVPTMHHAVLAQAQRNAEVIHRYPLRFIRSCSAPLPSRVMAELEDTFKTPVIESYGMTEAAHQIASNPLPPNERKIGSVGLPTGTEVSVIDNERHLLGPGKVGEIIIRGESVIGSYANDGKAKEESFAGGWFKTGDQGYLDSEGYLYLTGRLKDIINRGGEKISPYEVESALSDHAAIAEAVVFPLVHETLGEDIAAAVVLKDDAAVTETELRQFILGKVAEFKIPRRIEIVEKIPKGPTGKLQRSRLAEQLGLEVSGFGKSERRTEYVEPHTTLEVELVKIWEEVLRIKRLGIHDNFFDFRGNSLLATQAMSRIRQVFKMELPLRVLFENPTIAELATRIEEAQGEDQRLWHQPMVPVPRDKDLPLSFSQQRLWFLDQYEPNSSVYNVPSALRLSGSLDIGALEQSLSEIIHRHESLRTTFSMVDGEAVQVIAPSVGHSLAVVDLQDHPEGEREKEARRLVSEEARQPFDLAQGPLFRSKLLRLGEDDHVLLLTMHHIVSDGWSMGVLHRELSVFYEAFSHSQPSPLPELPIQYADYAVWQREWLRGEVLESQLSYWKKQLEGIPSVLNLPTDQARPAMQSFQATRQTFVLPRDLTEQLKVLSRKERVSLYMTLLAAFKALLYQYTGQTDLVIGSPIAGRNCPEIEGLIGFFVNTLVLRTDLSGKLSFRELLKRVREVCLGAYAHQELPYQKLVEALGPKRNTGLGSLVRVFFAFQNVPRQTLKIPGLTVTPVRTDVWRPPAALTLFMWEVEECLTGSLDYATELFNAVTIGRMIEHFQTLLNAVVADPERRLLDLSPFVEQSRAELLEAIHWATEQSWPFETDATAEREQGEL